jgi:hypothetical protein
MDGPKPKKGDIVTFEFDYGTRTVAPANPKITRIRKDLSWEEVQRDYERDSQLNGTHTFIFIKKKKKKQ